MAFKFFGGKKQKFYAELDESKVSDAAEIPIPAATSTQEPVATSAPETPEVAPTNSKKKSKKTTVKNKSKNAEPVPAPAPAPVVSKPKVEPTEVAFASKNLLTPTLVRRRPGPSLAPFKAIAREISPRR